MALSGRGATSDLSPQSAPERTLTASRVAVIVALQARARDIGAIVMTWRRISAATSERRHGPNSGFAVQLVVQKPEPIGNHGGRYWD